jgi:hypothetical protein
VVSKQGHGFLTGFHSTIAWTSEDMVDGFLPRSAREAVAIDAIVLCGSMVQSGSPIVEKLGYLVELSLREAIQGGPYAFPINIVEGCIIPNIGYKGVVSE